MHKIRAWLRDTSIVLYKKDGDGKDEEKSMGDVKVTSMTFIQLKMLQEKAPLKGGKESKNISFFFSTKGKFGRGEKGLPTFLVCLIYLNL